MKNQHRIAFHEAAGKLTDGKENKLEVLKSDGNDHKFSSGMGLLLGY